jgi:histidine triad (HIT) family protein
MFEDQDPTKNAAADAAGTAPAGAVAEQDAEDCLFCRIARQEVPAEIVFHDQDLVAFYDINPKAPVHILVVPRQHIESLAHLEKGDQFLVGNMIWVAKYLAESHRIADAGYKVVFNAGEGAGQTVPHLHLHLLGGKSFGAEWPV